jgi:ATP-dependent DNA helicase RecG
VQCAEGAGATFRLDTHLSMWPAAGWYAPGVTATRWPPDDLVHEFGDQERDDLEFKRDLSNRDLLRKAVCALANDLGDRKRGVLLVGIDKSGSPTGIPIGEAELLKVAEFRNEGRILPPPAIAVSRARFKGRPVIRVDVTPAAAPPVQLDGRIWVRVGPSTRPANPEEERVLNERRRFKDVPFDSRPLEGSSLDDLDLNLFQTAYLPAAVSPEVLMENDRPLEQQLASLRLATPDRVHWSPGCWCSVSIPRRGFPGPTSGSSGTVAGT